MVVVLLPDDCWAHVLVFACCTCERPARFLLVSRLFAQYLDKRIVSTCSSKVHFDDDMWGGQQDGPCMICSPSKHFLDRTLKTMRVLTFQRTLLKFRCTYVHFSDKEEANAFACYLRQHAHGIYPCGFCCEGKGVKVKVVQNLHTRHFGSI